jgi:hypothetical protein
MYKHVRIATTIADLLDNRFKILGIKFGLDPLLGLIPGIGDFIALLFSFYIIWIGLRMKLPEEQLARMVQNVILDFVIGLVPVLGDVSDFVFKANTKNIEILKKYTATNVVEGRMYT